MPSVADAKAFPERGVVFAIAFRIDDVTTGNPLTGGLTGLTGKISKSAGVFVTTTSTPVEIGTTGYGYVFLSITEMDFVTGIVTVSASNANAKQWSKELVTGGLDQIAVGVWDMDDYGDEAGRTPLTVAKQIAQIWRRSYNRVTADGEDLVVMKDDNATVMMTMSTGLLGAATYKGAADNEDDP